MSAVEDCPVAASDFIDSETIAAATFKDAYRVGSREPIDPVDAFFAIFGHHPWWMKAMLIMRNTVMAPFVTVPPAASILTPARRAHYAVGDTIGPWPIFGLNARELVAGRDNPHLDFRVSVQTAERAVVVSTVCTAHNTFGQRYLHLIAPFHRFGLRRLMRNAVQAGRL